MLSSFILFAFVGTTMGCISAILFFQFDKEWSKGIVALMDVVLGGSIAPALSGWLGLDSAGVTICLIAVFAFLLTSFLGVFYKLCQIVKEQNDGLGTIRTADILLHYDKFLEQYYTERLSQNGLEKRARALDEKEKQINRREEAILRREDECVEQLKGTVAIVLPDNARVPITENRVLMLPRLMDRMIRFSTSV